MRHRFSPFSLLLAGTIALSTGCAQRGPAPLYMWDSFPRQQYDVLVHGANASAQIGVLEAQAEKARAAGASLPPGFRAHLGMLNLSVGQADKARQLWQAEKAAFPESAPYMNQLIQRIDAPAKSENPA